MVLVDTSVWIDHFYQSNQKLIIHLERKEVVVHSAVLGELSAGSIKNRSKILGDLKLIPKVFEVNSEEVLDFIESRKLYGLGLSWVDLQILASCLASKCELLTMDQKLQKVFISLNP